MAFINWGEESPEQLHARKKMEETMMFERMSFSAAMAAAAAAAGGSKKVDPTANKYVENDYVEDYFE
jgi:hypothetical protein